MDLISLEGCLYRHAVALLAPRALGDDGQPIDAAVRQGYSRVVVEAMGGGHGTPAMADALERAVARIPVVMLHARVAARC
jgi:L-asparaginase/Glu-tRNA(Gln) amidotransferase subunit D